MEAAAVFGKKHILSIASIYFVITAVVLGLYFIHGHNHLDVKIDQTGNLILENTRDKIERFFNARQNSLNLFIKSNQLNLKRVISKPDLGSLDYQYLENVLRETFPDLVTFTIADKEGLLLLDHYDGLIGDICYQALKSFSADPHFTYLRLHPNPIQQHFDMIIQMGHEFDNSLFFISFSPSGIVDLLHSVEHDNYEPLLLNKEFKGLIEFTSKGERNSYKRNWKLGKDPQLVSQNVVNIPNTLWTLAVLPIESFVTTEKQDIFTRTLLFATIMFAGGLGLVGFAYKLQTKVQTEQSSILRKQETLHHKANHDHLTGLPNRGFLLDYLEINLSITRRYNKTGALLFIDIDDFKAVNDNYGHDVGDELLVNLSGQMTKVLRSSDVLARLGGDEFIIVLTEIKTPEQVEIIAHKLLDLLSRKYRISNNVVNVSASIGICFYPQKDMIANSLLKCADDAMYIAKSCGKNKFYISNPK